MDDSRLGDLVVRQPLAQAGQHLLRGQAGRADQEHTPEPLFVLTVADRQRRTDVRVVADSRLLEGRLFQLVDCALVAFAITRLVPLAGIQFYVQGVLGVIALWPLAWAMRDAGARDLRPAGAG